MVAQVDSTYLHWQSYDHTASICFLVFKTPLTLHRKQIKTMATSNLNFNNMHDLIHEHWQMQTAHNNQLATVAVPWMMPSLNCSFYGELLSGRLVDTERGWAEIPPIFSNTFPETNNLWVWGIRGSVPCPCEPLNHHSVWHEISADDEQQKQTDREQVCLLWCIAINQNLIGKGQHFWRWNWGMRLTWTNLVWIHCKQFYPD